MKKYKFEPAEIVLNICMIYVHLGESKNGEAFCLAVSKDGRSYNHQLFKQAEDILGRVQINDILEGSISLMKLLLLNTERIWIYFIN